MRVLIVEDSMVAQIVLKNQMVEQGCEVDGASNGKSALDNALNNRYDLILMDIGLGDGPDGFEVTAQIKAQSALNKETLIYAVTAHGEPEYQEKAKAVGMAGYFNKPFTSEIAKSIVEQVQNKLNAHKKV